MTATALCCPDCGAEVEKVHASEGGAIAALVFSVRGDTAGQLVRRVRPATFFACMTCEWCSEQAPSTQFCDGCGGVVATGGCACD